VDVGLHPQEGEALVIQTGIGGNIPVCGALGRETKEAAAVSQSLFRVLLRIVNTYTR